MNTYTCCKTQILETILETKDYGAVLMACRHINSATPTSKSIFFQHKVVEKC